jgi:hypothetical protein
MPFDKLIKVKVILRPTVSRAVCPGVKPQSGSVTNFSFSSKFSLDSCGCYFVAPSLTRGRFVIYCCCLVSPAQSLSGLSSSGHKIVFYCPNFRDPPTWRARFPVYLSPRDRVTQLHFRALDSLFVAPEDSQGYGGGMNIC